MEVSFTRTWDPSLNGKLVPLNIDKRSVSSFLDGKDENIIVNIRLPFRFIVLRGSSGFYSYSIYEHLKEWPGFSLGETRIAFKLRKDK